MTSEEKILRVLEGMQGQLSEVRSQLSEVQQEQKDMHVQLSEVRSQLSEVQQEQKDMRSQLSEVQQEQKDMCGQIDENTEIIKAVLYNQECMAAKLEGLEATAVKADVVARMQEEMAEMKQNQLSMNDNIAFLVQKTLENSNAIQRIRLVK